MKYIFFFLLIAIISFYSCGTMTSVGSRFQQKGKESSETSKLKRSDTLALKEDFDISPNKVTLNLNDSIPAFFKKPEKGLRAWYNYDTSKTDTSSLKIIKQMPGYRVLVSTTDNLDEANKVKSDIYFRMDRKPVYISFDPPFYKVTTQG